MKDFQRPQKISQARRVTQNRTDLESGGSKKLQSPLALAQLQSFLSQSPSSADSAGILASQKLLGNQATTDLLQGNLQTTPPVQRKTQSTQDEGVQGHADLPVQRAEMEEEELLQQKPVQRAENRTGMPAELKSGVEHLSGLDLSDVQVHYNSGKPAQLGAYAYAQGNDIHVGPGQEKHLPHEAWHVVQQRQGRVKPTTQVGDTPINDDTALETEADTMGGKALASGTAVVQNYKRREDEIF